MKLSSSKEINNVLYTQNFSDIEIRKDPMIVHTELVSRPPWDSDKWFKRNRNFFPGTMRIHIFRSIFTKFSHRVISSLCRWSHSMQLLLVKKNFFLWKIVILQWNYNFWLKPQSTNVRVHLPDKFLRYLSLWIGFQHFLFVFLIFFWIKGQLH